jgi:hypothetical protein
VRDWEYAVKRAIGRLLRSVCVGDSGAVASEIRASDWASPPIVRDTVDAAAYHRIVPQLVGMLGQSSGDGPLLEETMRVYRSQTSNVLRLEALLVRAVAALSEAGIAVAAFKGPALAHSYYDVPSQRTYDDIDLLIPENAMRRADEALKSAGLQPTNADWPEDEAIRSGYGEVTYLGPNYTMLDLHTHPIREPAIRRAFSWTTADLLGRTTVTHVAGIEIPVLDPEDMLIAVATHACYDGAYRLGWLLDIARIEQSGRVRWDVLAERCRATGIGLPVQVVVDRARRTLGYHEASSTLARGPWPRLTAGLGAVRPVEQTFGQALRGGVIFRSTRQTAGRSLAALATLVLDEVAKPLLTDPNHRWKGRRRQRDRAPAHREPM